MGLEYKIDSTFIQEFVNMEQLSQEELEFARQKKGTYECHVMMKRLAFASWCVADLYRVVLYPREMIEGIKNPGLGAGLNPNFRGLKDQRLNVTEDG